MKKQRDNFELVRHMLEHAEEAIEYAGDLTLDAFLADRKTQRATLYCIQTVGEAASQISSDFRDRHSEISWKVMRSMRNILVHVYHGVDSAVVLQTVHKDLPILIQQLKALLATSK